MPFGAGPGGGGATPPRRGMPKSPPGHGAPVTLHSVAARLRALLRPLGTFVMLLAILLLLALAVGPRTGTYRTLTMLTGSMRPEYPPGAVLVDTPEPLSQLRVGQVLTYQIPVLDHHVESHRVIAIERQADGSADVQTRGDANNGQDPWRAHIKPGQLWIVRGSVPGLGSAIIQLRRPAVRTTLQYLLPALLLGWLLTAIWVPGREPAPVTVDASSRDPSHEQR
ncbi:MAG: hypothetical protein NVS3B26_24670 [Mycobacteriales bacterium]